MPMRIASVIWVLMLLATPAVLPVPASAEPGAVGPGAGGSSSGGSGAADAGAAAANRDAARWAELEAQARITEGDYDGAVQAEQRADVERRKADRTQLMARPQR